MKDYNNLSLAELVSVRRKMAETVNRQMRRLTEQGYTKANAMSKIALPWLERHGRTRFSTRKTPFEVYEYAGTKAGLRKLTDKEIEAKQRRKELAEINKMQEFMSKQTYSIKGIKEQRRKAKESFNKELGVNLTDKEVEELFELSEWNYIRQVWGYKVLVAIVRSMNENKLSANEVKANIQKYRIAQQDHDLEDVPVEDLFSAIGVPFKAKYLQTGIEREV